MNRPGNCREPQTQAAQKLAQAQSAFAEAQRATGQGAQEVSGQQQLANMPLREALELASQLNAEATGRRSGRRCPVKAKVSPGGSADGQGSDPW